MPPYLSRTSPWFAFLIHPRDRNDLYRCDAAQFLRPYCGDDEEFEARICTMPPLVVGRVSIGGSALRGEIVAIMRMPSSLTGHTGRNAVVEAVLLARRRGARVLGLGALTSPATGGGRLLTDFLGRGVTATNGNAFTAAVVRENVAQVARFLSLGLRAQVAVVGCTGSVGVAASKLLEDDGFAVDLVGRSPAAAIRLFPSRGPRTRIAEFRQALCHADIVVLLTHEPAARIDPESLRRGAIVIDCAQPCGVSAELRTRLAQDGSLVTDGALVRIPGFRSTYDFGLSERELTFACLAETYLFARLGLREHSVGRPEPALARGMAREAERNGIEIASLVLNSRAMTPSDDRTQQRSTA